MKCKSCGCEIHDNAKFCTNCGTPVDQPDMTPEKSVIKSGTGSDKIKIIVLAAMLVIAVAAGLIVKNMRQNDTDEKYQVSAEEEKKEEKSEKAKAETEETPEENEKEDTPDVSESEDQDTTTNESSTAVPSYPSVAEVHVTSITASSSLAEYNMTHSPERVMDGSLSTAWVEGASGQGESETITICFDANCRVSGMRINAGYQKSADLYSKNSRPSVLRVIYTDGTTEDCALQDINGMQEIHFSREMVTGSISLMIVSVYPGTKYSDTVISEIQFF
ncbi:MAG: NADase-type glycan-binding domain-containing protein [Dorea sp.]